MNEITREYILNALHNAATHQERRMRQAQRSAAAYRAQIEWLEQHPDIHPANISFDFNGNGDITGYTIRSEHLTEWFAYPAKDD